MSKKQVSEESINEVISCLTNPPSRMTLSIIGLLVFAHGSKVVFVNDNFEYELRPGQPQSLTVSDQWVCNHDTKDFTSKVTIDDLGTSVEVDITFVPWPHVKETVLSE